ncbi:hypothetical protein FOPE_05990 [Fonsecaea pedrosoi]|nr:hypothetical protein FOPE_05990 [Fonsecaea pedrosoi]
MSYWRRCRPTLPAPAENLQAPCSALGTWTHCEGSLHEDVPRRLMTASKLEGVPVALSRTRRKRATAARNLESLEELHNPGEDTHHFTQIHVRVGVVYPPVQRLQGPSQRLKGVFALREQPSPTTHGNCPCARRQREEIRVLAQRHLPHHGAGHHDIEGPRPATLGKGGPVEGEQKRHEIVEIGHERACVGPSSAGNDSAFAPAWTVKDDQGTQRCERSISPVAAAQ